MKIVVYTEGSCLGNPGPGGYFCVVIVDGEPWPIDGGEEHTTNNRMEMTAAIVALVKIKDGSDFKIEKGTRIEIKSDSKYLIDGMNKWLPKWQKQNWKTTNGRVKNINLWKRLEALSRNCNVKWIHERRGHVNDPVTEVSCEYARRAALSQKRRSRK
jgi:ribonuclease HI